MALQIGSQAEGVGFGETIPGGNQVVERGRIEWARLEAGDLAFANQRREMLIERVAASQLALTKGDDEHHRHPIEKWGDVSQELDTGRIGPMEIFEQHIDRFEH